MRPVLRLLGLRYGLLIRDVLRLIAHKVGRARGEPVSVYTAKLIRILTNISMVGVRFAKTKPNFYMESKR